MIGKQLAHYEITGQLGKGGMGEVYRARDSKLGRDVAIKVLPKEMSGDPERAARFDREARLLASLQHANVASIYGFEHADGVQFLAMELVEGQSLEERVREGALPEDDVLRIARQMAAGLEAAHEKGIVHRDLKPANVMLTRDGDVKILDFGLARAWFGDKPEEENLATSPTITAAMTQAGTILGTAAYMSPEQARGRSVDRRADIWAFGVILWELLTGQRLFEGETISDTLAAVIRAEPDWDLLPTDRQPLLCGLIRRCLMRDPRQRLRDIGEARIILQEGGSGVSQLSMLGIAATPPEFETAPAKTSFLPLVAIAVLALAVGAVVGWKLLSSSPESQLIHASINPPPEMEFYLASGRPGPVAISPDGTMVVFAAYGGGDNDVLYLRHLDEGEAIELAGTKGAAYPFWSPDSQYIAFFTAGTDQKLKKISVNGGAPVTLCPAGNGKGGTWNAQGDIVFAPDSNGALYRVSSIGGEPVAVTAPKDNEDSHRHPRFLPDGRRFLFLARTSEAESAEPSIQLATLDGDSARVITTSQVQAEYTRGKLLTVHDGVLMATPFDLKAGKLSGGATPLVEQLFIVSAGAAAGVYSTSNDGKLVYQTGAASTDFHLTWLELGSGGETPIPTTGQIYRPRVSPDGRQAMLEVTEESTEGVDLWVVDLETGLRTRFTFDPGNETAPVWAPDGKSVYYTARPTAGNKVSMVMQQALDGLGGAQVLYESELDLTTESVTPDGAYLYLDRRTDGNVDVVRMPLQGEAELEDIVASPEDEGGAAVSPDGRWIAYHATSKATWDVFVAPLEGGPRKWQITTSGTVWPVWNPDGNSLLMTGFEGNIISYQVTTSGSSFVIGKSAIVAQIESPNSLGNRYSIHPDGKRMLVSRPDTSDRDTISDIQLVTDWERALMR